MTVGEFQNMGTRLRHARRLKKLRLKDLARIVSCSESLLSKIECNKVVPSLDTLHRVAAVLDTTVAALFSDESKESMIVYQDGDRPSIPLKGLNESDLRLERLIPYTQGQILNANIHIIPPAGMVQSLLIESFERTGKI